MAETTHARKRRILGSSCDAGPIRTPHDRAMTNSWDAIVVGARCAGAPTALLLAKKGYRVLVVDSAKFPSDTLSTHLLHPPAVAALERFGVLARLKATGCPAIEKYSYDFGPFTLAAPPAKPGQVAYCPRRTVLDTL